MTKYLVSGYIGFDNFGDELIAKILAEKLHNLSAEQIVWISSNPEKTSKELKVKSVGMLNFLPSLFETDILISGGGSLLQDLTSLKSLIYYILIITLALLFNKKVIIFAQGFSKFRTKIGEFMTKFVLKRCHKISVRDENSYNILKSWNINSELTHDPAWCVKIPQLQHKGVGIQLRYTKNLTKHFLEMLAINIAKYYENETIKLISLQNNTDIPILEEFAKILTKYNIKSVIVKNNTIEGVIAEIVSLDTLITMRFHAALIGVKSKIKVIGINYDKKVEQLAKETQFELLDMQGENMSDVFADIKNPANSYIIPDFELNDNLIS